VKAAYRDKVKQLHPDSDGSVPEFLRVQEAYEFLLTQVFRA
jgi:curved DNA-binding protein CbpA